MSEMMRLPFFFFAKRIREGGRTINILLTKEEWERLEDAMLHCDPERYRKAYNFLHQFDDVITVTKHDDGIGYDINIPWLKIKMEGENK